MYLQSSISKSSAFFHTKFLLTVLLHHISTVTAVTLIWNAVCSFFIPFSLNFIGGLSSINPFYKKVKVTDSGCISFEWVFIWFIKVCVSYREAQRTRKKENCVFSLHSHTPFQFCSEGYASKETAECQLEFENWSSLIFRLQLTEKFKLSGI